ncbi:TetR/AcrR family transcriptional regulator [Mobilicoccus pelagius]|uniref:Putative TetR family transcriptional regulator n=1 Tax=Mobilicoccus pelagius NBRC 104925 TaxID=1089455 RepID=H5UR52_9MICO|nr:TetR/AcrR family transcriptional regulator [Mobilicoccus pelagius]GAB48210.1 putative TetR family transcriptional regulator [Mobilicoccus pelagius NBRC 104925]
MPRIAAATVREHRENVRTALVDAAESIARSEGVEGLTAGAVTKAAGIARNSIYRYVDSVDDLRGLVLERHLPGWTSAVTEAVEDAGDDPAARILAWADANLVQAADTGHGWLMDLARGITLGTGTRDAVDHAHRDAEDVILVEWRRLLRRAPAPMAGAPTNTATDTASQALPDDDTGAGTGGEEDVALERRARIGAELTRSLVNGGFRLLDHGDRLAAVAPAVLGAVEAMLPTTSSDRARRNTSRG